MVYKPCVEGFKLLLRVLGEDDNEHGENLLAALEERTEDIGSEWSIAVQGVPLKERSDWLRMHCSLLTPAVASLAAKLACLKTTMHSQLATSLRNDQVAKLDVFVDLSRLTESSEAVVNKMQNDSAAVHDRRNSVATLNAPELTGHVKFSSLLTTSDFCSPVKSFSETLWSRILEVSPQRLEVCGSTVANEKCYLYTKNLELLKYHACRVEELALRYRDDAASCEALKHTSGVLHRLLDRSLRWGDFPHTSHPPGAVAEVSTIESDFRILLEERRRLVCITAEKLTDRITAETLLAQNEAIKKGGQSLTDVVPGILIWETLIRFELKWLQGLSKIILQLVASLDRNRMDASGKVSNSLRKVVSLRGSVHHDTQAMLKGESDPSTRDSYLDNSTKREEWEDLTTEIDARIASCSQNEHPLRAGVAKQQGDLEAVSELLRNLGSNPDIADCMSTTASMKGALNRVNEALVQIQKQGLWSSVHPRASQRDDPVLNDSLNTISSPQ